MNLEELIGSFIILWAVIDPVGTIPIFLAVTKGYEENEKKKMALSSTIIAFGVLLFFLFVGELVLKKMGVPLAAFQTSGGIILFLFALNMIFGSSKLEEELELIKNSQEVAVFPLAIPSIAGPGTILAVVLLADSSRGSVVAYIQIVVILALVLFINFSFMRLSGQLHKKLGNSGAIIISKIMGLILASVAANNVLMGIRDFFKL